MPNFATHRAPGSLHDLARRATEDLVELPFKSTLSLLPLIEFWEQAGSGRGMPGSELLYQQIRRELDRHPSLLQPIDDVHVLAEHRDLLDLLMMPVFAPAFRDHDVMAALVPFKARVFYATQACRQFMVDADGFMAPGITLDRRIFSYGKIIAAYLHILRTIYGVDVPFEFPLLFSVKDELTGLDRHFKITSDFRFLNIRQTGEAPVLTQDMKNSLLMNLADLETWTRLIPPGTFELYGFDIIRAVDVTDVEVISLLERDLLEGEGILSSTSLPVLRDRIRVLLRLPEVHLGLAVVEQGKLLLLNKPGSSYATCLFRKSSHYDLSRVRTSLFAKALWEKSMQIVEDLNAYADRTEMEEEMLEAGARAAIAAPLYFQGKAAGVLYVWSERPGELTALNMLKLLDVLPLFSMAVRRGREELRSRVQSVILNEYTAIHPSVEWRFRQAALNYIRRQEEGLHLEVEPIVFHDVYALYAATDIRGSSTYRNEAVMSDLAEHLSTVIALLQQLGQAKALPILDYLLVRTEQHAQSLRDGMSSGEEANIRDFFRHDVEPVLRQFEAEGMLQEQIRAYFQSLDSERGHLYRRHREFDESVTKINRTISSYLEEEERKAQATFPHYFEKHQTDGVEFTIYIGASLVENGDFDDLYVRNLRLWQLMVLCGIARKVAALKSEIKVPLETTHLVLTQSTPISIRFRFDETRFDVDGTHDIRYEIMKQRIEKAELKDREERLTQPDKIAIVYSQMREALEYAEYIRFLQQTGYLTGQVEDVELSDLQGMIGLKALRVTVVLEERAEQQTDESIESVEQFIRRLPAEFAEPSRN
jgi:hypothetical protein